MRAEETALHGAYILEPKVHGDERGFFMETWRRDSFESLTGFDGEFVQDNHSRSTRGVLRGLHYQVSQPQGKIVRVIQGEIFDAAVDVRRSSPTFGRSLGLRLSAEHPQLLWLPPGLAHGFLTLSESAEVIYKATDYYLPDAERTLLWNDPDLGISWPNVDSIHLSSKDRAGVPLKRAERMP